MLRALIFLMAAVMSLPAIAVVDNAPVRVKHLEAPSDPPARLPRNLNYQALKRKWGVEAWWAVTTTRHNLYEKTNVGNGMFIALMSPELIAAVTSRQAANDTLSDDEAQHLYILNLKRYYGDLRHGRDTIVFAGYVQIDEFAYTSVDVIDSDWTFSLTTDDGKTFAPTHVTWSKFAFHDLNEEGTTLQRKAVTVTFANNDPATHTPILSEDTPALTLELSGKYGAVKARFSFARKQKPGP